jgi:hypothetical protein
LLSDSFSLPPTLPKTPTTHHAHTHTQCNVTAVGGGGGEVPPGPSSPLGNYCHLWSLESSIGVSSSVVLFLCCLQPLALPPLFSSFTPRLARLPFLGPDRAGLVLASIHLCPPLALKL